MSEPRFVVLVIIVSIVSITLGVMMMDYYLFRHAGGRFTAGDGVELCETYHALADHVGYEGPRPVCDYSERHR